jgi:UPF0716 protein FxsA
VPALLVVVLVVVPIAELWLLIQVGQQIGVLPTVALLILDSLLGAWLLRREGRRTWQAFRAASEAGRVPAKEVADGALVIFGGALLLTPGFLSDALGLLCILPPTRALVRRSLLGVVTRRFLGPLPWLLRRGGGPRPVRRPPVVEGEVLRGPEEPPVQH